MKGGEAAHPVEAPGAEREGGRVGACKGQVAESGTGEVGRAALQHRPGGIDSYDQPAFPDRAGELTREVARPAGEVEHRVAAREPEQETGDPRLLGHSRAGDALRDAAQGWAPVPLVDRRHQASGLVA